MFTGFIDLPWWGYIVVALTFTHITIASVTIFLHRHQAHRALELHAIPSHFFRFWLWLSTGMVTKEWAAIHRKHHAKCETEEDPHSPQVKGLKKVFFEGAELYRAEAKNQETMERYGHGTPDDWMERNVYKNSVAGVTIMAIVNIALFGPLGLTIWAVQMMWIPIWAAGVINGIGHFWGYRNYDCADASRNLIPWGIIVGGEELHNNHHTFATSAKLSAKWYEFDIGWMYIRILSMLGLATVKKTIPVTKLGELRPAVDLQTLQAVIANRYDVMTRYVKSMQHLYHEELAALRAAHGERFDVKKLRKLLLKDAQSLTTQARELVAEALAHRPQLAQLHQMRQELMALWARSSATREQLLAQLQDWCARAEASGMKPLQELSQRMRSYVPA